MTNPLAPARCPAGNEPARCCIGDPWTVLTALDVQLAGEPLPSEVISTAEANGIEPHALDHHVEGAHGWEPHDPGYAEAVQAAAACMVAGGCEATR